MNAIHVLLAALKFALALGAVWFVINVLAWCFAGRQADDDSANVARNEGIQ